MFRRNIFSILVAIAIAYLSLAGSDNFNKPLFFNFRGADKVMHFLMYFGFMSIIVFENRKNIGKLQILLIAGLIPFFYGLLMELLQTWFTQTRSGSVSDMLFNLAGILFSVIIILIIRPLRNQIIR
jgi:VanZ family protein